MEGKTVAARIHDLDEQLTAAGRRAARGLLGNYPLLGLAPVAEFAAGADVSAATIVRFVAQLGFKSYPDFQRALREELEERSKSPLQRGATASDQSGATPYLSTFLAQSARRLEESAALISPGEFETVCRRLAETKRHCYLAGGRFTDFLAGYLEAHLRLIRPGIRRLDGRPATAADQLIATGRSSAWAGVANAAKAKTGHAYLRKETSPHGIKMQTRPAPFWLWWKAAAV